MVEQVSLAAEPRTTLGTRQSRKLRATGKVPAVVYGHGEAVRAVAVNLHDLTVALQHGARMMTLDVGGTPEQVLVKEVQYDYLGATIIHADFTRISLDEKVTLTVALHFRGTPKGLSAEGAVLMTPVTEIEIECLPGDIPNEIPVSVIDLEVGGAVTVADLKLPDGVVAVTPAETTVAQIRVIAEEEEAPAEAVAEGVEPEVIGAKPEEGEGEAEAEKA
jgi:large subunit ribosomal protein L25